MRWCCYPIALVADIVKMYLQVKVSQTDTNFQRIFWRENDNAKLQHLRLLRVTFGISSAPFLAIRALRQVVEDEGADFPLVSNRVLTEFYMDDFMSGCYSTTEGKQVYDQMNALLNRGGFPLQKWSSNSHDLMAYIYGSSSVPETNIELKPDNIIRILGLTWNRESDSFQCIVRLPLMETPVTKRRVVSDIARLFDPLGWLAPVITKAKIFIQRLWLSGIDWDDTLPSLLLDDWLQFRNGLERLSEIRIPRWFKTNRDDRCVELHGFSDASNHAYAAVVYIRVVDRDNNVHVSLLTAKTRVAPLKQVSIPRLELCGAVLLAKLLKEVAETIHIPKLNIHAWTDSSIVLAWLSSHPSRWKTFIANRVSEILTTMDSNQWFHVASKDNPADCASRGEHPSDNVTNELWKCGPKWLYLNQVVYNRGKVNDTDLEEKKIKCCVLTDTVDDGGFS